MSEETPARDRQSRSRLDRADHLAWKLSAALDLAHLAAARLGPYLVGHSCPRQGLGDARFGETRCIKCGCTANPRCGECDTLEVVNYLFSLERKLKDMAGTISVSTGTGSTSSMSRPTSASWTGPSAGW